MVGIIFLGMKFGSCVKGIRDMFGCVFIIGCKGNLDMVVIEDWIVWFVSFFDLV